MAETPPPLRRPDRIGSLPDELLLLILSLLPARSLVATSVLSRRWLSLWTLVTHLDIDLSYQPSPSALLNRILEAHASSNLLSCSITHLAAPSYETLDLHRWIPRFAATNITKLSLDCRSNDVEYDPYRIICIPTLLDLFLADYTFHACEPPPDAISLHSLRLKRVYITDRNLSALLANAPLLERLGVNDCYGLLNPIIKSDSVKRLEVEHMPLMPSLEIVAPALTTLKLHRLDGLREISIYDVPSLSFVNTTYICDEADKPHVERWCCGENLEVLMLLLYKPFVFNPLIKFRNNNDNIFAGLHKLFLGMNLNCEMQVYVLTTVLEKCTNLQELGITNEYAFKPAKSTYWTSKDTIYCLQHRVKHLWIKGFTGHGLELEFLIFILSKALMLKRLVISYNYRSPSDTLEAVKSILQTAPPSLNIIIKTKL